MVWSSLTRFLMFAEVKLLERTWKVTFEGESPVSEDDFELDFIDIKGLFEGYVGFETTYFEKLLSLIEGNENYNGIKNLKSVVSPDNEEFIEKPVALVLAIDKNDLRYGFLLFVMNDDTVILGVWPQPFFDAVNQDKDLMNGVLGALIENVSNWKRVDIVIPIGE